MTTHITYTMTFIAALMLGVCFPLFAHAETVNIVNNVSSSANSGGNYAEGGTVVEGQSSNRVYVRTVVNGEVVEEYEETSSEPIHYETKSESTHSDTTIQNTVNTSDVYMDVEETLTQIEHEVARVVEETIPEIGDEVIVAATPHTQARTTATTTDTTELAATSSLSMTAHAEAATNTPALQKIRLLVVNVLSYVFGWFN